MLYFLYSAIFYAATPFIVLRLLWRSRYKRAYRQNIAQRFAYFTVPTEFRGGLWIHTVSLGEVITAAPLIKALRQQHPDLKITLTTMTITGSEYVKAHFVPEIFHVFVPYDLPCVVRRFLNHLQPQALLILETELWPNILKICKQRAIPVMLSNARLSEKSAKRYNYIRPVIRNMLSGINVIATHAKIDGDRFMRLGATAQQITTVGSIKFDIITPASVLEQAPALRQMLGANRPILIAASTHEGEEEKIVSVFNQILKKIPQALLLLAPRHPERFARVASYCEQENYKMVTYTSQKACTDSTQIFLIDTIGQLKLFYAVADVAFVGGSLMPIGGHNILEPLSLGIPTIVGPYMFNFEEMSELLLTEEVLLQINTSEELANITIPLLEDSSLRAELTVKAEKVLAKNKGAVEKNLRLLEGLLTHAN
jgi:3-deoxy-D-manno-octulosonic-acid transferase